jgi:hypothetical protein
MCCQGDLSQTAATSPRAKLFVSTFYTFRASSRQAYSFSSGTLTLPLGEDATGGQNRWLKRNACSTRFFGRLSESRERTLATGSVSRRFTLR